MCPQTKEQSQPSFFPVLFAGAGLKLHFHLCFFLGAVPLTLGSFLRLEYNGMKYTVEKDADTGLIFKILDSDRNEFEPKINSEITDTALHNAVFWAVAMHSGFGRVVENLLYIGGKRRG